MRSWTVLVDFDGRVAGDVRSISAAGAQLRLDTSSELESQVTTHAAFGAVAHRPADRAARVLRDGALLVTGNIRLDDRESLRKRLDAQGELSDLALFLLAWRRWNNAAAEHILGDFSLAVWDQSERVLTCIRDRLGVRPLYYAPTGSGFAASDVLESVLACESVDAGTLDPRWIGDYLQSGIASDAASTVFASVRRLPAASILTVAAGAAPLLRSYWEPAAADRQRDPAGALEESLTCAVRDRTRGERAVVFLSGGLDSSTLAWCAARSSPGDITAVTSVYRTRIADEEEMYAAEAARSIGIPHKIFPLDSYDPLGAVRSGLWSADPGPLLYACPTRAIYRATAALAPVALHGHPADALLADESLGMLQSLLRERQPTALVRALIQYTIVRRRPPYFFLRALLRRRPAPGSEPTPPRWFTQPFAQKLAASASAPEKPHASESLRGLQSAIWSSYFEFAHPLASRAPVELSYPFADPRVIRVALALEPIPWRVQKHVLREVLRGRVSERVRTRPKRMLQGDPWQAPATDAHELPIRAAYAYIDADELLTSIRAEGGIRDATLRALVFDHWLSTLSSAVTLLRTQHSGPVPRVS